MWNGYHHMPDTLSSATDDDYCSLWSKRIVIHSHAYEVMDSCVYLID